MDTTKTIKRLVILELLLILTYLVLSFILESRLPALLQEYLMHEFQSESSTADYVVIFGGIPVLAFSIIATVGLLCAKVWAGRLYIIVTIVSYTLSPFIHPTVEHAASNTILSLATMVSGAILALLLFTDSVFNQTQHHHKDML